MNEVTLPTDLNLLEFLGNEQTNLLVSIHTLRQEMDFFAALDHLYQQAVRGLPEVSDQHAVPAQLLIYCHYHLYFSMATILRCHLSDALTSLRTAIEAGLHAYRIIEGHGTAEQYVGRDRSFLQTVKTIRKARKSDASVLPLAAPLIKVHEGCSQFAAHADFDSFAHRLHVVRNGGRSLMKVNYFQKPEKTSEFQFYIMTLLHSFVVILNLFEKLLTIDLQATGDEWSAELRQLGAVIERCRGQLRTPDGAEGLSAEP